MIKGISFLRRVEDGAAYQRLEGFFEALGFERGRGWEDTVSAGDEVARGDPTSARSRGASFLAPLGNLEFIDGRMPPLAELAIEVTSLDAAHQAAAAWFRKAGLDPAGISRYCGDSLEIPLLYSGAGAGAQFFILGVG